MSENDELTIYEEKIYMVNDPWYAVDRGFFFSREDAELFVKYLTKNRKKEKNP